MVAFNLCFVEAPSKKHNQKTGNAEYGVIKIIQEMEAYL